MPLQLPSRLCADLADAVVGAKSLDEAYNALNAGIFDHLLSESVVLLRKPAGWVRVAGRVNPERERAWRGAIERLPEGSPNVIRITDPVGDVATAIQIASDEPLALVVEGDWTASSDVLNASARVVGVSLRALRQRDASRRAERLLQRIYRLAKRIGSAPDDTLATHIVDQVALIFAADRVSIALFDPAEKCLRIKAAHGTPMSVVHDIKIRPGDWVIGRVYATGKAVTVNDVRALPSSYSHQNRYRSQAFAVVPLTNHGQVVGVLSITDTRDITSFGAPEQFALRTVAAVIGSAVMGARADAEMARLEHAASVDSLTGLLNRSYLDSRLQQEVARSQREGTEFAVLMADIDNFKTINDTGGHQAGDAVLKGVGDIMRSAVRVFDVCARWGGDEFAVLMPNSDHASAMACAERIRQRTAQYLGDVHGGSFGLTISIGVAVGGPGDTAADLIARADRALYDAKAHGKDAVRLAAGRFGQESATTGASASRPEVELATPTNFEALRLPYVLVADPSQERAGVYRAAADQFRLGLLVARSGEQAARVMEQFGPPVMLVVDMTAAAMRGVALIEAAHAKQSPILVVAFSSSRGFREYCASRPNGHDLHVLRPDAPIGAVTAVIERALQQRDSLPDPRHDADSDDAANTRRAIADLATRSMSIVPAPGVAVYLKEPGETKVRATVTWVSDATMARAHHHLPGVIDRVLTTEEPLTVGAVGAAADTDPAENTYGLVGAPVRRGGEVVGAVCAFGDGPLALEADALARFDELAATAFSWGSDGDVARSVEDAELETAPGENLDNDETADIEWQPTLLERRRGEFAIARELARIRREQRQLSVVLFDVSERERDRASASRPVIDDRLLNGVADTLVRAVRQSDLPIQWSGSELLLVLPGLAGVEARGVAERVRAAMQAGGQHRVAVAGGVAQLDADERFLSVVSRARAKLTEARDRGHNRVS